MTASNRGAAYGLGFVVGLAAVFNLLPLAVIGGWGGVFQVPPGDLAQNLTGHLAFQAGDWIFPPLLAPDLFWPHGVSIALTDSNPLLSSLAKLVATLRGPGNPAINLLGGWFAACWLLQPMAAVYALRGFGCRRWEAALATAILSATFPALLFRVGHINLCGHFFGLLALGIAARLLVSGANSARDWAVPVALLAAAVFVHPVLYILSAALLGAPALGALLDHGRRGWRPIAFYVAAGIASVALFSVLSGMTGGGDRGFGYYSMNLLSPVWPQRSGLFGADLPVLDDTGGQYEGFNYLGAGVLLLIAAAGIAWSVSRRKAGCAGTKWRALLIVLIVLTVLAVSSEVHAGHTLLFSLGTRSWDIVFGAVRSSGRLFWPVGYALMLGSIAILSWRLPRLWLTPLLAIAVALQLIDIEPMQHAAQDYFATARADATPFAVPNGTRLLTTSPVCVATQPAVEIAAQLRLQAVRLGARLSDIKVSRLPFWFNCESQLSDAAELPLLPGEVRVLLEPIAIDRFRQAALGEFATCRRFSTILACARDAVLLGGEAIAAEPALPVVSVPGALDPMASFGWKRDAAGSVWSEGPRATLQARVLGMAQDSAATLRLRMAGIARDSGGDRTIVVQIGATPPITLHLADGRMTEIALPVSAAALAGDVLRISFDILRPIDPSRRSGVIVPVNRAGLRLDSATVTAD